MLKNYLHRHANYLANGLFALVLLAVSLQPAAAQKVDSYKILTVPNNVTEAGFYPFGGYKIVGKKPAEFSNFNNFTVEFTERPQKNRDLKTVGAVIITKDEQSSIVYQFVELSLSDGTISFKTETTGDIRYEFNGKYIKKGELVRYNEKKTIVLRGVLARFENDRKAAEKALNFSFVVWKAPYYAASKK